MRKSVAEEMTKFGNTWKEMEMISQKLSVLEKCCFGPIPQLEQSVVLALYPSWSKVLFWPYTPVGAKCCFGPIPSWSKVLFWPYTPVGAKCCFGPIPQLEQSVVLALYPSWSKDD